MLSEEEKQSTGKDFWGIIFEYQWCEEEWYYKLISEYAGQ